MPSARDKFATAITCIDGRIQRPVADWIKLNMNVHHVDLVTEPGPDEVMSSERENLIHDIMRKVSFSVRNHFSPVVALSGHHDCAANSASKEVHIEQILEGVRVILSYDLNVRVLGLWVNEWDTVDLIWDSEGRNNG